MGTTKVFTQQSDHAPLSPCLCTPKGKIGVNFGISLSLWDYLFNTHHVPDSDGSVKLGFPGDEKLPSSFKTIDVWV